MMNETRLLLLQEGLSHVTPDGNATTTQKISFFLINYQGENHFLWLWPAIWRVDEHGWRNGDSGRHPPMWLLWSSCSELGEVNDTLLPWYIHSVQSLIVSLFGRFIIVRMFVSSFVRSSGRSFGLRTPARLFVRSFVVSYVLSIFVRSIVRSMIRWFILLVPRLVRTVFVRWTLLWVRGLIYSFVLR